MSAAAGATNSLRREIMTPEGVPLPFTLASAGDRAGALLIDLLYMIVALVLLGAVGSFALGGSMDGDSWLQPLLIVAAFLIANFYFVIFELRWQGVTPGKRHLGLRVIDARGGQLEGGAILARNLIRELEIWMPLRFLVASNTMWPGAPGWAKAAAVLWTFVFLLLPLFNRDRLRVGDLIAGTWVVRAPKAVLLPDLAAAPVPSGRGQPALPASFVFTDAQLGIYGEYELTVLEQVLREATERGDVATLVTVAGKIQDKLKFSPRVPIPQTRAFLTDFYTAQRAHLEKRMLFGRRKADKFES